MRSFGTYFKHLWLGALLVVLAAGVLILSDMDGRRLKAKEVRASGALMDVRKICVVSMMESEAIEALRSGIAEAYRKADPSESKYDCRFYSAHGDIGMLAGIMDSVRAEHPDLVMTMTTPALQAAIARLPGQRIVFCGVADIRATGAGTGATDHMSNVTGIMAGARYPEMADFVHRIMPGARRLGTLYNPAEPNSVVETGRFARELARYGIEYVLVPVNSTQDIPMAADSLCARDIDAVCQIGDNTVGQGLAGLVQSISRAKLPLFGFEVTLVKLGATGAMCRDYYDTGIVAGSMALKVLSGADPATMPVEIEQSPFFILSDQSVDVLGLTVPQDIQKRSENDRAAFNKSHPKNQL